MIGARVLTGARVVAGARVIAGGKYSFSTAGVGLGVALVVATIFGLTSVGKLKLTTGFSYIYPSDPAEIRAISACPMARNAHSIIAIF